MTAWMKSASLKQLGMQDSNDPRQTVLYKLSQDDGFDWFQDIILFSSPQDSYSPFDSSRIQISKVNQSDQKMKPIFEEMVRSLLRKIQSNRIKRVNICMKFSKQSLDTFIGRAAHIALITDGQLLDMLSIRYAELL